MLQIVYISSGAAASDPAILDNILAASRRNNGRAGVTGLLVAGGRRFLQVLEGPESGVRETYARIQADPRHRACVLISSRTTTERCFGKWSMAFEVGRALDDESDFEDIVSALTEKLDPNLRAQFTGFARLHSHAA